jgi:DNA-directed RNA polymerase
VIEGVIPGAAETMDFLQELAERLARCGLVLQWTSPTGLPWANRYQKSKTKRVRSLLSGVCVRQTIADGYGPGIRLQKSKDAASANFIHALDAAHVVLTKHECVRVNMPDILAIHDSYSCLAPRAEQLNSIVREQFVTRSRKSERSALQPFKAEGERVAAAVGIPTPNFPDVPKRGDLDLREFIKNVYAFS